MQTVSDIVVQALDTNVPGAQTVQLGQAAKLLGCWVTVPTAQFWHTAVFVDEHA